MILALIAELTVEVEKRRFEATVVASRGNRIGQNALQCQLELKAVREHKIRPSHTKIPLA